MTRGHVMHRMSYACQHSGVLTPDLEAPTHVPMVQPEVLLLDLPSANQPRVVYHLRLVD